MDIYDLDDRRTATIASNMPILTMDICDSDAKFHRKKIYLLHRMKSHLKQI